MLIIFESPDKSGKTTLSRMVADYLNIPYLKLNNINVVENTEIKDGISISTHSQLETVTQLYEKGVMKNAVLDRFHGSEIVYSNLFKRAYDVSYIKDIDERLSKYNDVILVRCRASYTTIKSRFNDEKIINESKIRALISHYKYFYNSTKLPVIEIDTDGSVEKSFAELVSKLELHGISQKYFRQRRITHEEAMLNVAKIIAQRSPDLTRKVGAVITENGYIVAASYNGPPSGMKHDEINIRLLKGFKSGEGLEFSRAVHAEQNALLQAGLRFNRKSSDLILFSTDQPCIHCMRMCIQAGIKKIYYINPYPHELALEMAKEAGVELIQWKS